MDIKIEYHGSISVFYLLTERAQRWVRQNLNGDLTWWSSNGLVVEQGSVDGVIDAMLRDGLDIPVMRKRDVA